MKTQFPQLRHVHTMRRLTRVAPLLGVNDVLFLQHLLSDIYIADVLEVVRRSGCRLFVNIHDWMHLLREDIRISKRGFEFVHRAYLPDYFVQVSPQVEALFAAAERVLHPSAFTHATFSKYFDDANFLLTPHIDEQVRAFAAAIPPIKLSTINIGVLHHMAECKGAEMVRLLMETTRKYHGFRVVFKIVGVNIPAYGEGGFVDCLAQHNIHGLTLLNKWGETYCYALTKFLNSGLPILYNNFGAFKERVPPTADGPYFKVFETEKEFRATDCDAIRGPLHRFLDYIISNARVVARSSSLVSRPPTPIVVPPLYNFFLNDAMHVSEVWQAVHRRVLPYCFYASAGHVASPETDALFYPGMTDVGSVVAYNAKKAHDAAPCETPCPATLPQYSHSHSHSQQQELVNQQIKLATHWGMRGFCVHYYWFSRNDVTGRRNATATAARACHDLFFNAPLVAFNVFFCWDNADWSPAVGNTYEREHLQANVDALLVYFTHANYLKLDNCPVLVLLHPEVLTAAQLATFHDLLQAACLARKFNGIQLVTNLQGRVKACTSFLYQPNLNADADLKPEPDIQTLILSFNNAPRCFNPSRPETRHALSVTPMQQHVLADAAVRFYKVRERRGVSKLLLINAWNEWGKGMAVEPSAERGCFYLKLLKLSLSRVL